MLEALGLGGDLLDAALAPKIVHVAGTKGKGSTSAMVESVFRRAGLRTGLFTSPHLVKINERFRVQGKPIDDSLLALRTDEVFSALETSKIEAPPYFAFLVLLGFHVFAKAELDVIIIEVGLGGRLDYTNVIDKPDLCLVTLLDLDHTEILGDTIEEIAAEKAGIFKHGVPVLVCEGQEPAAQAVLEKEALAKDCSLKVVPALEGYELGLAGDFQTLNAGLAAEACRAMYPDLITEAVLREGLASTSWPGRAQVVELEGMRILMDGAHTPKSMICASEWAAKLLENSTGRKNVLIFNCMHSRNPVELFKSLIEREGRLNFSHVIFSPSNFNKPTKVKMPTVEELLGTEAVEGLSPSSDDSWQTIQAQIYKYLCTNKQVTIRSEGSLKDAVAVIKSIEEPLNVFVTGSLLLVGDFIKELDIPIE